MLTGALYALLRCGNCGTAVTVEHDPPDLHETGARRRRGAPLLALPLLRLAALGEVRAGRAHSGGTVAALARPEDG